VCVGRGIAGLPWGLTGVIEKQRWSERPPSRSQAVTALLSPGPYAQTRVWVGPLVS
jgi:hypothetical protein